MTSAASRLRTTRHPRPNPCKAVLSVELLSRVQPWTTEKRRTVQASNSLVLLSDLTALCREFTTLEVCKECESPVPKPSSLRIATPHHPERAAQAASRSRSVAGSAGPSAPWRRLRGPGRRRGEPEPARAPARPRVRSSARAPTRQARWLPRREQQSAQTQAAPLTPMGRSKPDRRRS